MGKKTLKQALREQNSTCKNPNCSRTHGRWNAEKKRSVDLSLYYWNGHQWALCDECASEINAQPMDQDGDLSLFPA